MRTFIYVLTALFLALVVSDFAEAKEITENNVTYSCKPKASCNDKLAVLKRENAELKKQLKAIKDSETPAKTHVITQTIVKELPAKTQVITRERTVQKIKKHIVSVVAVNGVRSAEAFNSSSSSATASVKTGLVPALTYQYQFDMGLVPLVGVSGGENVNLMLGLGLEF